MTRIPFLPPPRIVWDPAPAVAAIAPANAMQTIHALPGAPTFAMRDIAAGLKTPTLGNVFDALFAIDKRSAKINGHLETGDVTGQAWHFKGLSAERVHVLTIIGDDPKGLQITSISWHNPPARRCSYAIRVGAASALMRCARPTRHSKACVMGSVASAMQSPS